MVGDTISPIEQVAIAIADGLRAKRCVGGVAMEIVAESKEATLQELRMHKIGEMSRRACAEHKR